MEKENLSSPFLYVVGSGAYGLLFNQDLKDKNQFTSILKSDLFGKQILKIKLMSNSGIAEDEEGEWYHWGEIDFLDLNKV